MTKQTCIVKDCPAYQRPCGCGWLEAGQECHHSQRRDEWHNEKARRETQEASQMEMKL